VRNDTRRDDTREYEGDVARRKFRPALADNEGAVVSSLLRIASLLCSAVLVLSFAAFAADQAGAGSKQTVARIASADSGEDTVGGPNLDQPSPNAATERLREKRHGALRERLDDADDALVAPFKGASSSGSIWTQRAIAALLALLVFGVGLHYLARLAALRGI
jgi:hypothetical protein